MSIKIYFKKCPDKPYKTSHEGLTYYCDQCEHRATQQRHLTRHIQPTHEGVRNDCDQCEYQATRQVYLVNHIKVKHEGVRYLCDL